MTNTPASRFVAWQLASLARSCLFSLIALCSIIFTVSITVVMAYLLPLPSSWDSWRFIGGFIVGMMLVSIMWLIVMMAVVIWRKQKLSAIFEPLQGKRTPSRFGVEQRVDLQVEGLAVNVLLQRGPMLTISVPISTGVRAAIRHEMTIETSDSTWTDQWLKTSGVQETILHLLTPSSTQEVRTILVTPTVMMFRIHRLPFKTLSTELLKQAMHDFTVIIKTAQSLPATEHPVEPNAMERINDRYIFEPSKMRKRIWLIMTLFIGLVTVTIATVVIFIITLAN